MGGCSRNVHGSLTATTLVRQTGKTNSSRLLPKNGDEARCGKVLPHGGAFWFLLGTYERFVTSAVP